MAGEFVQPASDYEKNRDGSQPDEQRKFSADRAPKIAACFSRAELHPLLQTCAGAYRLGVSDAIKRCDLRGASNRTGPAKSPRLSIHPQLHR